MPLEHPANILLVDDKIENLVALESILESPGYRFVRAQSGDEALLALLNSEYAAIVLDVKMPGMSGIELAQIIRTRKKTQHIPILFLTAQAQESMVAGYEAGAVDFLTKPIQAPVLRSKVAVFVDLFRKTRALEVEVEERRQAEERIRQLNEELSQRVSDLATVNADLESFCYSVSHDLRAPLRQASGFVSMLQEGLNGKMSPDDLEYVELVQNAVSRMGQLIDDLLSFSQMGRAELRMTTVNFSDVVNQALETLEPVLVGRNIEWCIADLPNVQGDLAMLRQVLVNLLDNAIKFTRTRDNARIELGYRAKPEEYVFHVRDNGVGFDPRYSSKLFGVFQRLHHVREFEGTGIGLANVRRIIQRHGGRTWAESVLGEGTTLYFSLPIRTTATKDGDGE